MHLTQHDFDDAIEKLSSDIGRLDSKLDGVESRLSESIRGLNLNLTHAIGQEQATLKKMDERLIGVETELTAILEESSTRKELQNLVRELKATGVQLDEARIFLS